MRHAPGDWKTWWGSGGMLRDMKADGAQPRAEGTQCSASSAPTGAAAGCPPCAPRTACILIGCYRNDTALELTVLEYDPAKLGHGMILTRQSNVRVGNYAPGSADVVRWDGWHVAFVHVSRLADLRRRFDAAQQADAGRSAPFAVDSLEEKAARLPLRHKVPVKQYRFGKTADLFSR